MPYEPPGHADVTVHTDQLPVGEAATRVFQALVDLKYVGPTEFGRLTGGLPPAARQGDGEGRAPRQGGARRRRAQGAAQGGGAHREAVRSVGSGGRGAARAGAAAGAGAISAPP